MIYSRNQILALAPDDQTKRSAYNFARPKQWIELEGNENILWGTCKTYNRKYQVWASLAQQRFKCSCKNAMPCRHVLGLLLIYIQQSDAFRVTYDLPEKIDNWLKGKVESEKPIDPKRAEANRLNRLKTWEKRMTSMAAGLDELEIWLQDVIRQGLAELENQSPEFWESIASRLVDTKLGSIARRIRLMPEIILEEGEWHQKILAQLGDIFLILQGFRNMASLPDNLQKEILNLAGVNYKKDTLRLEKGILDNWIIIGQVEYVEENLKARRTWLIGENSKRWALFLDFAWGRQDFEQSWKTGKMIESELVFYPSAYPLRAIPKLFEYLPRDIEQIPAYPNHTAFLTAYSKALAENPWIHYFPCCIKDVIPVKTERECVLLDTNQHIITIQLDDLLEWKLLALSGGKAIRVFGEWHENFLKPLSAFVEGRLIIF